MDMVLWTIVLMHKTLDSISRTEEKKKGKNKQKKKNPNRNPCF